MRQVQGNVQSDKLPGGNLIAAALDRQLMTWSDRGGASRYFGDRWSAQCSEALDAWIGEDRPVPGGASFRLEDVVRLDDDPRIAIQAGRHKLVNPDFVLYGRLPNGSEVLQAADAKFAVDTIKSPQVSADALKALLAVEGGLVRVAIEEQLGAELSENTHIARGVFISPVSPLTDFFLPRVTTGARATVDPREVVLLPVVPVAMFSGLPMTRLIGPLARLDRLPVSPRDSILAAMYYFRIACACAWMWVEERTPLLTLDPAPEVDADQLLADSEVRISGAGTAFEVLIDWYDDVESVAQSRKALSEVTAVPVRMRELREMVEAAGRKDDRRLVRQVRGALERQYRTRLAEEIGTVPAKPDKPLTEIMQEVARVSRSLGPELRALAVDLVNESSDTAE